MKGNDLDRGRSEGLEDAMASTRFRGLSRSVDGRPYRGWNALVLWMVAADRGWSSTWATCRGWQRNDCQVREGERGTQVVLWKPIENKTDDEERTRSMFARAFTVFNAEQVEGGERSAGPTAERSEVEWIADADVKVGDDQACYVPARSDPAPEEPSQNAVRSGVWSWRRASSACSGEV